MTIFRYKKNGLLYTIQSQKRSHWKTAMLYATPYMHNTAISGVNLSIDDFIEVSTR